jgi:phage FluMu protein Com
MSNTLLREQRCECGKLLLKGIFLQASLEIKCKKCGKINKIGEITNLDNDGRYLLVFNEKGVITNADDSAYHMLGYGPSELLGKHLEEIATNSIGHLHYLMLVITSTAYEDPTEQAEDFAYATSALQEASYYYTTGNSEKIV